MDKVTTGEETRMVIILKKNLLLHIFQYAPRFTSILKYIHIWYLKSNRQIFKSSVVLTYTTGINIYTYNNLKSWIKFEKKLLIELVILLVGENLVHEIRREKSHRNILVSTSNAAYKESFVIQCIAKILSLQIRIFKRIK